jgi:tol-pal system protein YbgF
MKKNTWVILASIFVTTTSGSLLAADNERTVENRLDRIERLVDGKGLVEIMVRLENIQAELQRLLGEVELQKHAQESLKKRQRDLYLDIDRRLLQIERRSGSGSAVNPAKSSAAEAVKEMATEVKPPLIVKTPAVETRADPVNKVKPVPLPVTKTTITPEKVDDDGKNEQVAYQSAFDLLRALRYDNATEAFRQFLNDYPHGRYAHIAQYWLAETSYHTRKYDIAVRDYQDLINKYPNSPKRADALLKIGYSQFELKELTKSKDVLETLIQTYPGTTEAGQAENLLQKIRLQKSR